MPWNYYNEWKQQQQQQQTKRLKKELFQRVSTRFNVFENENKGKNIFVFSQESEEMCSSHIFKYILEKIFTF